MSVRRHDAVERYEKKKNEIDSRAPTGVINMPGANVYDKQKSYERIYNNKYKSTQKSIHKEKKNETRKMKTCNGDSAACTRLCND